jgi:hypothetical protein
MPQPQKPPPKLKRPPGLPERYHQRLTPEEELRFQDWAKRNSIRMEPGWNEDYDMRGLWKSDPNFKPDARGHFPDTYKMPNHPTFSNESIYATPIFGLSNIPRWVGSKLIDPGGRIIADETPTRKSRK